MKKLSGSTKIFFKLQQAGDGRQQLFGCKRKMFFWMVPIFSSKIIDVRKLADVINSFRER